MDTEETKWAVDHAKCRICGAYSCVVYPWPSCDSENMECHNCGNMTMDSEYYKDTEAQKWKSYLNVNTCD